MGMDERNTREPAAASQQRELEWQWALDLFVMPPFPQKAASDSYEAKRGGECRPAGEGMERSRDYRIISGPLPWMERSCN